MAWIKSLREKLIILNMLVIMSLIILATIFTWYNKKRIVDTTLKKQQAELVKTRLGYIFREYLRGMDLGLRGYALTKNKQVLSPYENALTGNATNLRHLDSLFRVQHLDTALTRFEKIKEGIESYVATTKLMKAAVERDSLQAFVRLLNQDKGYDLWVLFSPFNDSISRYEDQQIAKAQSDYESALNWNILIQLILAILGIPSILYIIYKTNKEVKERKFLLAELDENNKKYLFHPSDDDNHRSLGFQESINQSIDNFKKAVNFIKEISNKNFEVRWAGIDQTNLQLNESTLAGELIKMRNQMKQAKQEDDQRFWTNDGLAQFSQLVRQHQSNLSQLCQEATSYLAHYVKAHQASLFTYNNDNPSDTFLELTGTYAIEANKAKRRDVNEGLLGQAFSNGETMLLKDVPSSFVISSGLGQSTPASVCIVPLKFNNKTEGVIELSSFSPFESHVITFLEKAGEFIASSIVSTRVSTKMELMLNETQQQAEEMRSQEEEMRQNMEELTATQEEIHRQGQEAKDMVGTMISILNQLPQKIFLKDKDGKMVLANLNVAKTHNLSVEELIGKSDFDFVDAKTAQEWRNQELEIVKKGSETYTFDEVLHGQTKTLTTTKMAFYIPHLKQTGLLGIQTDVTELQALKKKMGKKQS